MIQTLKRWFSRKATPTAAGGSQWTGSSFVDSYRKVREPTPNELAQELKGAAWTCASINAAACASYPPKLYVTTTTEQPAPKCLTKPIGQDELKALKANPRLTTYTRTAVRIEEVVNHPVLDLLAKVNPIHNGFDLWELTALYLEVHGKAFWKLDIESALGIPEAIWPLPAQNMRPVRDRNSPNVVDYWEYRAGSEVKNYSPEEVVFFHFPDPKDPYLGGLSPMRACYEQVGLASEYAATKRAIYENRAIPSVVISPDEVIGEEERDRLEIQWNQKFRRGGIGKALVTDSAVKVNLLQQSMGDLAALADMKANKEDIANAFHVPLAFLVSDTNLANLQAAEHQHMSKAIRPRLLRRDEKLNERLMPLYDPSGRLFLASQDPVPINREMATKDREVDLKNGVITVNEVRIERGLPPVPWGDKPFVMPRVLTYEGELQDNEQNYAGQDDAAKEEQTEEGNKPKKKKPKGKGR